VNIPDVPDGEGRNYPVSRVVLYSAAFLPLPPCTRGGPELRLAVSRCLVRSEKGFCLALLFRSDHLLGGVARDPGKRVEVSDMTEMRPRRQRFRVVFSYWNVL